MRGLFPVKVFVFVCDQLRWGKFCQDRQGTTPKLLQCIYSHPIATHAIYPPRPNPDANPSQKLPSKTPSLPLNSDYSFPSSALSGILGVPPVPRSSSLLAGVPVPPSRLLLRAPSFNFSHLLCAFSRSAFIFVFSMVRRRISASRSAMRDCGCWFIALKCAIL